MMQKEGFGERQINYPFARLADQQAEDVGDTDSDYLLRKLRYAARTL